jgi:hypothetical protein
MKRLSFILACLGLAAAATARPLVIGHSVVLRNPDQANYPYFGRQVAIDGDHALVLGENFTQPPGGGDYIRHRIVWVFHRDGTAWNLVGPLAPGEIIDGGDGFPPGMAMRNGLVVTLLSELRVYRLVNGAFVRETVASGSDDFGGPDLETDGARILISSGGCSWNGVVYERDATGTWRKSNTLVGSGSGCGDDLYGGPLDVSGERAVLFNAETVDTDTIPPHARLYRKQSGAGWLQDLDIFAPSGATLFGPQVALRGNDLFVGGSRASGTYVYDLAGANPSTSVDRLRTIDSYAGAGEALEIEKSPDFILQRGQRADRYENTQLSLFQKRSDGRYAYVAMLIGANGEYLRGKVDISSSNVISSNNGLDYLYNEVYIFNLPTSLSVPAIRQDNFESGASAWTQSSGSQFAVVQKGSTRVFRQTNDAIDARAFLSNSDWTSQAIEADVTVTGALTAQDRGVGVFTRWQNPQNYYQAVLTSRGVWLSRMGSGRLTQITISPDFNPQVGRTYRLRLESNLSWHRVYVDGAIVIDAIARGPTHGRVGLVTETNTAEFDNVLVTPNPRTPIYSTDFTDPDTANWSVSGPGVWTVRSGVFAQSSTAGDARALIGTPTDDQVVRARAQLGAFGSGGTAAKWFGVLARASNTRNYYYLSLRSNNTLQLRKLVNGAITTLASKSFTVTRGTPYDLQLEAVGTRIRARVNGVTHFDLTDTSHAVGQPGLVAYRAAVDYDNFEAVQP